MRHRRLVLLPLGLAALLAGCQNEGTPASTPMPISMAPIPTASEGVPEYVCAATQEILTEGAERLATLAAGTGDEVATGMQRTLADMATQVAAERTGVTDIGLLDALQKISEELSAGATRPDPLAYVNGDFQTVGQKLDGLC
ncbi:hypothetical protein [Paractinoplanes lichenicola]|uniref:Lipoprotein n=1 Tax=Paractinoplanes lichenicola TaxID=2802976 RepID=A0ABS1VVB5_9ACTN|nr:hypothetical protein [Actinoplanes lichenicola]MBL7258424.1 hypothetical protein [Actinoplanes lichenicola]